MEPNNKNPAFLANSLTPMPKDQDLYSFARPFEIVLPNIHQLSLSMKKSKKEALELKIENTAHLANLLNPWPENTGLGIFLSQSQGFLPIFSKALKALLLTMALASLCKPEALEPDFSIEYKASSQHKTTEPYHLPHYKATQFISSQKHIVARPDLLL